MAGNRISVLIDVAVEGANRSLKSFRQSIADADGAAGKMKAGVSGAMDSVKANAGNLAMAGGAALIGFGVKAVGAFQETALEAGKLSDSLGLTTEEASRMMEVSGDLGIGVGALETSLGKMNLAAARTPDRFAAIGASIAKNVDGTTNVQQTFLNAVDAINKIPDATKRADAASRIFGKGWREISELIGRGSGELKRNLEDVADSKVISEKEVAQAREFRDRLDELNDSVSDITVAIGGALVPALTDAAEGFLGIKSAAEEVGDALGPVDDALIKVVKTSYDWLNPVGQARTLLGFFSDSADDATTATESFEARMYTMQGASRDLGTELEDTAGAYGEFAQGMIRESKRVADKLTADWDRITGKISDEQAWLSVTDQIGALEGAWLDAMAQGEGAYSGFRQQQLDAQMAVAEYIQEVGGIPPEKVTAINALIDEGKFAEAVALLDALAMPRDVQIRAYTSIPSSSGFRGVGTSGYQPAGANITINAGLGTDPIQLGRAVSDAMAKYKRSGGG